MSFWGVGIGAATSLAGGMMQAGASGEAAATAALGAEEAAALYGGAEERNDKLITGANQWGQKQYAPWDALGQQGTKQLSRYLGIATPYNKPKPEKPKSGASKAETARYERKLARWKLERDNWKTQQQQAAGFGDYFDPYEVPEPVYKPYKDYEQFTQAHLDADPLYETELDENVRGWDQSAASKGSLMSGNTVAALRDITSGGISRARDRHIQDYNTGRANYLQDYGITHDEWLGGYDRDWNEDERKYNALAGLSTMGLGVRNNLAGMNTDAANRRVQNSQWSTSGQANARIGATSDLASGQLAQGTAMGNAFGNVGQLGMLYGIGAFGRDASNGTYAGSPRQKMMMYGTTR